jgi:hypothetical protein
MSWMDSFVNILYSEELNSTSLESAFLLKFQNLPSSIFKYRDINPNSLKNLRESTIWLADPKTLNDPYDCAHTFDLQGLASTLSHPLPKEIADRFPPGLHDKLIKAVEVSDDPIGFITDELLAGKPNAEEIKKALLEMQNKMFEEILYQNSEKLKGAFKLCSFSERVDSTLMWAHYADYHKGFCVEYDISAIDYEDYLSRFLYPVIYSDEMFKAAFVLDDAETVNNLHLNMAGLVKSKDWSYEKEWRLLFSNGVLEEAQAYPMPTPKTVYLGSHVSPADQEEVLNICSSLNVGVKKMKHSSTEFRMSAQSVEDADRAFFGERSN